MDARLWGIAIALAGCEAIGSSQSVGASVGELVLEFDPTAPSAPDLVLSEAKIAFEGIAIFGDVAPDPRTMLASVGVDMYGGSVTRTFDQAPPALYSRVHAKIDAITFQGTYRGMPIQAQIDFDGMVLDVRDPVGEELGPGLTAVFDVAIDGSSWFQGIFLDTATISGDHIVIDSANNVALGQAIATNVVASMTLKPLVTAPH